MRYSCIENGKRGYRQEFTYDDIDESLMTPIVHGNNTKATEVIISVRDKTYEQNIEKNNYFIAINPERISFNEDELNEIYSKYKGNIISVKFLDDYGKEIKTGSDLDKIVE